MLTMQPVQMTLEVERIRQHPGPQQVQRAVVVNVPGKHFPQLQVAEQKVEYPGTAVEFKERHSFPRQGRRLKAGACSQSSRQALGSKGRRTCRPPERRQGWRRQGRRQG
jgi:hypothetical protein